MLPNPFSVGRPSSPEQFIGRSSEINVAFDQISSRSHLAIYGSDGIGKSSLLQFVASPQTWTSRKPNYSEAYIVFLNCTEILPFKPTDFWREILELLKDKSDNNLELQSQINKELNKATIGQDSLRRVLKKIGHEGKFLLLLLDEFDVALYSNENYSDAKIRRFLSTFRTLAVHREEGQHLSTIVTSCQRLNKLSPKITRSGSPWYNHYLFLPLLPFTEAEVNTLLNRMPKKDDEDEDEDEETPDLQQGIREITGGHPALLQNACFLLHSYWRNQQNPDVDDFVRKFLSSTEHFFSDAWKISTQEEKMLLMLIALTRLEGRLNRRRQYKLEGIDLIFSQMDQELRNLADRGVIQRSVKQNKEVYAFSSSIMEWWVIKEIENSKDEAELEQRQKVLLNLSSKQVEQITTVMKQVWKNKDVIKSFAGWVGGLGGAFAKGWVS